jgi:hypothetical protein
MTPKTNAAWTGVVTFICTALVTIFREFEPGYAKGIWFLWFFFSWNYFAYAFDRDMWPWVFSELYGRGKGKSGVRKFHFWGTLAIHLSFLSVMAFANT